MATNAVSGARNDTVAFARRSIKAFWSLISSDLDPRDTRAQRGETGIHLFASGRRMEPSQISLQCILQHPHLTFMSPFYAFLTSDTPESAKRVRSPLSAGSRNVSPAPAKVKHIPRPVYATFAFCHLVTQTWRRIIWLMGNKS